MRFYLSACAIVLTTLLAGCDVPGGGITVEQTDTGIIIEITCPGLDDVDGTDDGEEEAELRRLWRPRHRRLLMEEEAAADRTEPSEPPPGRT